MDIETARYAIHAKNIKLYPELLKYVSHCWPNPPEDDSVLHYTLSNISSAFVDEVFAHMATVNFDFMTPDLHAATSNFEHKGSRMMPFIDVSLNVFEVLELAQWYQDMYEALIFDLYGNTFDNVNGPPRATESIKNNRKSLDICSKNLLDGGVMGLDMETAEPIYKLVDYNYDSNLHEWVAITSYTSDPEVRRSFYINVLENVISNYKAEASKALYGSLKDFNYESITIGREIYELMTVKTQIECVKKAFRILLKGLRDRHNIKTRG